MICLTTSANASQWLVRIKFMGITMNRKRAFSHHTVPAGDIFFRFGVLPEADIPRINSWAWIPGKVWAISLRQLD
jgi:hypothetical protein